MRIFRLAGFAALLLIATTAWSQDRDRTRDDRDRYYDREHQWYTRLLPGMSITVRPTEAIDVERNDNRVYTAVVDQDVTGDNGRLAIPRGSTVELIVRVARDNDLILDLESVTARGQRYAIGTEAHRIDSAQDNSLVGAIVGAINNGQVRGRAVRIPRNTLLTFRIDRPLEIGIPDRGIDRDGRHYHDYRNDRDRQ